MKKGMFNDKFGLTGAVLAELKTMTRRENKKLNHPLVTDMSDWGIDEKGKACVSITYSTGVNEIVYPAYQVGEKVAIAQRYSDIPMPYLLKGIDDPLKKYFQRQLICQSRGYKNKMFVAATLMPHHILITNLKFERLKDISDEDIMREGIMEGEFMNTWDRYYYDSWGDVPNHITFPTARAAFASLIDRISGRGTWERNPWVFAYEFKLID